MQLTMEDGETATVVDICVPANDLIHITGLVLAVPLLRCLRLELRAAYSSILSSVPKHVQRGDHACMGHV